MKLTYTMIKILNTLLSINQHMSQVLNQNTRSYGYKMDVKQH